MSLLKYFSKPPHGDVSKAAVSDHDASADLPSEAESDGSPLSLVTASGDTSESEFHSVVSGSSSLPEVQTLKTTLHCHCHLILRLEISAFVKDHINQDC